MKVYVYNYKILLLIFWLNNFFGMLYPSLSNTVDFQLSAFEELLAVNSVPYNQLKFTYGILSEFARTGATGSGSVTSTGAFAVLSSGTGSTGSANLRSKNRLIYHPGQGSAGIVGAIFSTGVTGNSQIIGLGNIDDGFFFGYTGTQFGILWRSSSSGTPVDTWIPQTSWNVDTMNGTGPSQMTLNPRNGNVYKIQFQWLGFGAVRFYIEDQNGNMQLVHLLQYANTSTQTTIRNPSLQLRADVVNFGNTGTNIELKSSAMVGMSEGKINELTSVRNAIEIANFSVGSTDPALTHVLTIYNKSTYQGRTNQIMVQPDYLSLLTTQNTNRNGVFYVYLNPTFSTTGTFTDVDTNNSVIAYSTGTTTTVSSNGRLLGTFFTNGIEAVNESLKNQTIFIAPNDYLSILASKTAGAGTFIIYLDLSWEEYF